MNPEPIDLAKVRLDELTSPLLEKARMSMQVLRTDLIHPLISGNKWYKLKGYLQQARETGRQGVITAGGPYSNHLHATAAAARLSGLHSVGLVSGEAPSTLTPTLEDCRNLGMELIFIPRSVFRDSDALLQYMHREYPIGLPIPQGGQSELGIEGAATMLDTVDLRAFSHICCAVGTGTMMAGLMRAALPHQEVVGFPVLKFPAQEGNSTPAWIGKQPTRARHVLLNGYHEGGYAKWTPALIQFMNEMHTTHSIPSDFVYTGKLFRAVFHLSEQGYFPIGSKLLLVHSGGIQGNRSLSNALLRF